MFNYGLLPEDYRVEIAEWPSLFTTVDMDTGTKAVGVSRDCICRAHTPTHTHARTHTRMHICTHTWL